jgi:hypothetical protein
MVLRESSEPDPLSYSLLCYVTCTVLWLAMLQSLSYGTAGYVMETGYKAYEG